MNTIELKGISKSFGQNSVLKDVDFCLGEGEIHALMGENGAGKSTLMNIVYGALKPDSGEIFVGGEKVQINRVQDAQKLGICFVQQEIALCQDVTVAENIFMSRVNEKKGFGFQRKKQYEEARKILEPLVGDSIDPGAIVSTLSISSQQVVEIAKAISDKCRILILDEPTAALSSTESEGLYKVMQDLKKENISIIYISHRMSEIFEQCDKVSVLRDGRMISTYDVAEAKIQKLVNDMAGREVDMMYPPKAEKIDYGQVCLEVKELEDAAGRFSDISFKLHKGEILGFSGMLGAGRSEIMSAIVGLRRLKSGQVIFKGRNMKGMSTSQIYNQGLVLLPEDRKKLGLFLEMDIEHNVSANYLELICSGAWINKKAEHENAEMMIEKINIRCTGANQLAGSLSGGNQQKVLIAKVLAKKPDVVIVDEPTRGIDVGAKAEVHRMLRTLANEGIGIIMVSSDMNEVLGMSDRVIIIGAGGRMAGEVTAEEINSDTIMYYASGANQYKGDLKKEGSDIME